VVEKHGAMLDRVLSTVRLGPRLEDPTIPVKVGQSWRYEVEKRLEERLGKRLVRNDLREC
jgi:hypothetical protein